ncbi:MAG: hypothetical protein ABIT04_08420 [Novosphingobium sp.]
MTAKKAGVTKGKPTGGKPPNNALAVCKTDDEDANVATARALLGPDFRHAIAASQVLKPFLGKMDGAPGLGDYADAIQARGDQATKGELGFASRTLAAQAITLDTIFAEMARRMALNMGEHLAATETYARIAMKAQAQSRATLEALAKLHQPREQTVRHVHVNEGGQAVIADQFHHHAGGQENGNIDEQSRATGPAGSGQALLGADPFGSGVPIPSREGEAEMQDARRN